MLNYTTAFKIKFRYEVCIGVCLKGHILAFHLGKALIDSSTFFPVSQNTCHFAFEIIDLVSINMEIRQQVQKLLGRKGGLQMGICKQNDHECPISVAN